MLTPHTIAHYARALKPHLPPDALKPARGRLWWLPVHVASIALSIAALASHSVPWGLAPFLSLLIGCSAAGLTFLAHELLHGAVVRGRHLTRLLGGLCFAPFCVSPRLWLVWHNRVHHGRTNQAGADPDAYPTLQEYESRPVVRLVTDHLGPGRERPNGLLSLLIGFTVQSTHMLVRARASGWLTPREHTRALVETSLLWSAWLGLAFAIGWPAAVFALLLPLLIANSIVMAFILTNHSLSPLTHVNDPLLNSLSVTLPRWANWLTLGFGYHVEHHLLPAMSAHHAPLVSAVLRERWPERYQSMPLGRALLALHRTGRVYKNDTTLTDPNVGRDWPTLLPLDPRQGRTPVRAGALPTAQALPAPPAQRGNRVTISGAP